MSPHGAMIECAPAAAPAAGTQVELIRGRLRAEGTIAWSSSKRCGVRFASELSVKAWLAAPTRAEQQRVDDVVSMVKAGTVPDGRSAAAESTASAPPASAQQLVDDLEVVCRLLGELEEDLASSEETLARHGPNLQNLDLAMQMLRRLAAGLRLR